MAMVLFWLGKIFVPKMFTKRLFTVIFRGCLAEKVLNLKKFDARPNGFFLSIYN